MDEVQKNIHLLQVLSKAKPKLRKVILKNADEDLIIAICACILNFMNGNIKTDEKVKKSVKKYKHILRKVLKPTRIDQKQQVLVQKGGFLPLLIPTILSGILSFLKE
jgi:preprotein translocase subunit Sss1